MELTEIENQKARWYLDKLTVLLSEATIHRQQELSLQRDILLFNEVKTKINDSALYEEILAVLKEKQILYNQARMDYWYNWSTYMIYKKDYEMLFNRKITKGENTGGIEYGY